MEFSLLNNSNEASLSMFCAQQEIWVRFLPRFHLEEQMTLLSGCQVGPWQAETVTQLPLWIAQHLQSKAMGRIVMDDISNNNNTNDNWMQVEPLKEILAYEKSHETLWVNDSNQGKQLGNAVDNDDEDDDMGYYGSSNHPGNSTRNSKKPYLPERYWEWSQSCPSPSPAVALLIQDLWQVRLDKLRRQFQTLVGKPEAVRAVEITGIGTAELAVMRRVIAHSLGQKAAFQRTTVDPSHRMSQSTTNNNMSQDTSSSFGKRPRRFRKSVLGNGSS